MAYLQYDTEKMNAVKDTYNKSAETMDKIAKNMNNMVETIKTAWKSEAGEAFFKKYNDEWLKGFNQYKEVLEHMAANLNDASGKYSEITDDIKALKIE